MNQDNPENATDALDLPIFAATLSPYRSLTPRGFLIVMAIVSVISFAAGYAFYRIGAWPVVGFCGLDVLAVYAAFRINYRAARAFEVIEVRPHAIVVRKVSARGRATEFRFNPNWVRLELTRSEDEGVIRICLFSRGQGVPVGDFLNPEDRTSFATAFMAAIGAARRR